MYIRFNEKNDNECETWSRFLHVTDPNLDKLAYLVDICQNSNVDYIKEAYSFTLNADKTAMREYTPQEVLLLLEENAYDEGWENPFGVGKVWDKLETTDDDNNFNGDTEEMAFEYLYKLNWYKNADSNE